MDLDRYLAEELSLGLPQVQNALALLAEGATIPFIARYRKERTGEMNEVQLRELADRFTYLTELQDRKQVVLSAIAEQGKLTDELQAKIDACLLKTELEDLYLPYRPKRRTRATIAREKGLEPLAQFIQALNQSNTPAPSLEVEAAKYISEEKGVKTAADALKGASDILAEAIAEKAELRAYVRNHLLQSGEFVSQIDGDNHPARTTKFEMYREFKIAVKEAAPHHILALLRGESEKILKLSLDFDREAVLSYLEGKALHSRDRAVRDFYQAAIADGFNRLMKASLTSANWIALIAQSRAHLARKEPC